MLDQIDCQSPFAIPGVTIGYVRSSQKVSVLFKEILRMVCTRLPLMYRALPLFAVDRFSLGQGLRAKTCDACSRQVLLSTDDYFPSLERPFNTVPSGHRLHLGVA